MRCSSSDEHSVSGSSSMSRQNYSASITAVGRTPIVGNLNNFIEFLSIRRFNGIRLL